MNTTLRAGSIIMLLCFSITVVQAAPKSPELSASESFRRLDSLLASGAASRDDVVDAVNRLISLHSARKKHSSTNVLFTVGKAYLSLYERYGQTEDLESAIRNLNLYTQQSVSQKDKITALNLVRFADTLRKKHEAAASNQNHKVPSAPKQEIVDSHIRSDANRSESAFPWPEKTSAGNHSSVSIQGNPYWESFSAEMKQYSSDDKKEFAKVGIRGASVKNADTSETTPVIANRQSDRSFAEKPLATENAHKTNEPGPVDSRIENSPPTSLSSPPEQLPETTKKAPLHLSKKRVITIDPGHGGKDPGAVSFDGKLKEKDITLNLAKLVKKHLEKNPLIEVLLTRSEDMHVPLTERSSFANSSNSDVFLSLHCNAANDNISKGFETFILNKAPSTREIRLAAKENSIPPNRMNDLQATLLDLMVTSKKTESEKLAQNVSRSLMEYAPDGRHRGIKEGPFYVLLGAQMPAVLVECAFLSNEKERNKLKDANYLENIAEGLSTAVEKYLESMESQTPLPESAAK